MSGDFAGAISYRDLSRLPELDDDSRSIVENAGEWRTKEEDDDDMVVANQCAEAWLEPSSLTAKDEYDPLPTSVLKRTVTSPETPISQRIEALQELIERRDDDDLAPFVLSELAQAQLDTRWRAALISAAESIEIISEALHPDFARVLHAHALSLRDSSEAGADHVLWSAIRRYSTLVAVDCLADLMGFLRPDDRDTTKQVALQAVQSILATGTLSSESADGLVARIGDLARKYLEPDWLTSGANTSLAVNAYSAAILAGHRESRSLTTRLLGLNKRRMARRARSIFQDALRSRRARGLGRESALIEETIQALDAQ